MPAVVEVGVRVSDQRDCQAPFVPKAAPVMVMEPAPLVMARPPEPVRVEATGAAPVEPISSWPLVKAVPVRPEVVPPPIRMEFWGTPVGPKGVEGAEGAAKVGGS